MTSLERLVADIPNSLKFLVDEDNRTNKRVVIDALETELGVTESESEAVIRRKIKRKERRFEDKQDSLEEQQSELRNLKDDIEQLREILDEKKSKREAYQSALEDLLDQLDGDGDPVRVFPEHGQIRQIAQEFEPTPDEVLYDLKELAVEDDRSFYNTDFMDAFENSAEPKPIEETFPGGDSDE